jgi:hypothetical protein
LYRHSPNPFRKWLLKQVLLKPEHLLHQRLKLEADREVVEETVEVVEELVTEAEEQEEVEVAAEAEEHKEVPHKCLWAPMDYHRTMLLRQH